MNGTSEVAGTVEAMRADFTLGQSDGFDERLYGVELQRGQIEAFAYLFHHGTILRRVGSGIAVKLGTGVTFDVLYHFACDEFHIALRRGKVDVATAIYQWRTGYAHVYLSSSIVIEYLHIVAQLGTAYDGVVAE